MREYRIDSEKYHAGQFGGSLSIQVIIDKNITSVAE